MTTQGRNLLFEHICKLVYTIFKKYYRYTVAYQCTKPCQKKTSKNLFGVQARLVLRVRREDGHKNVFSTRKYLETVG